MKKAILIDANAIIHRAFHALPPFKTSNGELVNAVYGFTSMLLNIILSQKPDYIATAFDTGKTFRHEEYEEYKATREKAPDELYHQFDRIKQVLKAFNIPIFEAKGFEADDILGTLAKKISKDPQILTLIATGDKDAFQLVTDNVHILMPHKGFKESIIYTPVEVEEKMELKPAQVVDFKGLSGDSSDNIKGVQGIGKKTAIKLLQQYETIEGIYENISEIKGALHTKLTEGKEDALKSQMLATIITDMEIDFDLSKCKTHEINHSEVESIFAELEFKSLQKKLKAFNTQYDEQIKLASGQQQLF